MTSWARVPFRFGEPSAGVKIITAGRAAKEVTRCNANEQAKEKHQHHTAKLPERPVKLRERDDDRK